MFGKLKFMSLARFYKLKYFLNEDASYHKFELRNGLKVIVNKNGGDLTTLFEVFVNEDYKFSRNTSDTINILDIGANVGYFSLYISKKNPNAKVFAFEPFPETYKRLCDHININNLKNITAFNYAVSDFEGTAKFYSFEYTGCNTMLEGNYDENLHKVTTIDCVGFAKIPELTNVNEFEFAKVDCEGSEYPIFLNSTGDSIKFVKEYIIEVHNSEKYNKDMLTARFENLSYNVLNENNLLSAKKKLISGK